VEWCGRSPARGRPGLVHKAEWTGRTAGGCRAVRQVVGLEVVVGQAKSRRAADRVPEILGAGANSARPLLAGRIRRWWGVRECAAMGRVVGLELVGVGAMAERIGVEVGVIRAARVRGPGESGGCSCR